MSLNNDNKTNLLFKKFQGVTQGSIVTSDTGGATYSTEPFKSLTGIFQNQIYSEDVPLTLQQTLRQMQNDSGIASSTWNSTTNNARDQTLSITQLQDGSGNNLPLAFYKDVYLDKVGANIQAWWLVEPNQTLTTENNVLADTIPWKYNDVVSSTYTPIVTYWKDSTNTWAENAQNDTTLLNWVMDYTSGMLVCYQPESTLQGYTVWSSTTASEDKKRPRISFIKYIGAKGAAGSSGGGSGSGDLKVGDLSGGVYEPTQDVSAIYFDNSQFDVSYVTQGATISLNSNVFNQGLDVSYLFFDVPDSCSNGSGSLVSGSTIEIDLSWNLPPTFKSALPFGPTQTYNSSGIVQTTNIGYLPYFKELKIEYKNWLTNSDYTQGWTDLNMGGSTNQPIIPSSVNSAHIGASSSTGPTLLDASGQQNSTPFITYQNLSALQVGGQYQFRVYLVNDGIEPGIVDPVYGGIVPYNYHYIPDVSGGFISLGQPGGPTSPTSISFQFTNLFDAFSSPSSTGNAIVGYNDDISGADISLNIPFSGTGPNQTISSNYCVNLQFHYQVDASSIQNPIQMPNIRSGYDASMTTIISGPSPPGFSNTITTIDSDLATAGIDWYPEYNYIITDFSMESFNVNGSLGVAAAQPSAYGTDSSFVSIIPSRSQAGAETNRIASSTVSITPQTSITTYSAYPFDSSFGTAEIQNIYFITDASSIDFNMNVANISGANNLDPNDTTTYRGIDSSGIDLTRFKMEAIDGSTNNIRYQSTSSIFTGYLDVSAVDISDVRFGLFAESTEGSSNSKAQGYYTDVTLTQNAEVRDVSLGAYPDICNNSYEPYTFKITDNYLDAGGFRQDGNAIETTLNIARKPLQDIAYGLAGLQPGSVTLNHSFFGLKMPELGAPAVDVDYSYNLTGIDPYWRPSFTISEDDLHYDPNGSNVLVSSSDISWSVNGIFTGQKDVDTQLNYSSSTLWALGTSKSGTTRYSRAVVASSSDPGPQLQIETTYYNNVSLTPSSATVTYDLSFGTPGKYLWWDYTWTNNPSGTVAANNPSSFFSGSSLSFVMENPIGASGWSITPSAYDHTATLPSNQLMWGNGAFRCQGYNANTANYPYIDYTQFYQDTPGAVLDYAGLAASNSGDAVSITANTLNSNTIWWNDDTLNPTTNATISRTLKYLTFSVEMPFLDNITTSAGSSSGAYTYSVSVGGASHDSSTSSTGNGYWIYHIEEASSGNFPSSGSYHGQFHYQSASLAIGTWDAGAGGYVIRNNSPQNSGSGGSKTKLHISIGLPNGVNLSIESIGIAFFKP